MAKMRIVGQNAGVMFIQRYIKREWIQETQTNKLFEYMMQIEYPKYWEEYLQSGTEQSPESYFYSYGEQEGKETYIFE